MEWLAHDKWLNSLELFSLERDNKEGYEKGQWYHSNTDEVEREWSFPVSYDMMTAGIKMKSSGECSKQKGYFFTSQRM